MYLTDANQIVSGRTQRLMGFLLRAFGRPPGASALGGLPPGAVLLHDAGLVLAVTGCAAPLFRMEMFAAADRTGADVVLMRFDRHSEPLTAASFDVLTKLAGEPLLLPNLTLYAEPSGYSLVPQGEGHFVLLGRDGIRLQTEPPYGGWQQRCGGIAGGAADVLRAACQGAF